MPASKAQQKAVTKYVKTKYDRFGLTMPKGELDVIKAHAETRSESVNGFIKRAIDQTMAQDTTGTAPEAPQEAGAGILTPSTLKAAQEAAEAAGEAVPQFVARAVETQAQRDAISRRMKGGEQNAVREGN